MTDTRLPDEIHDSQAYKAVANASAFKRSPERADRELAKAIRKALRERKKEQK